MKLSLHCFALPKGGNAANEYEDAYFPPPHWPRPADMPRFRISIADGATESVYAGLWARLLTESYARGRLIPSRLLQDLTPLQRRWQQLAGAGPQPWYVEEKLRQGAFSAWLGLDLRDAQEAKYWIAWAVGDCCLVQVRDDALIAAFPMTAATDFNNRPLLIGSEQRTNGGLPAALRRIRGTWQAGDRFLLMTDALAAWFLAAHEADRAPARQIAGLASAADDTAFAEWIESLRSAQQIRNDDTTLLCIDVAH